MKIHFAINALKRIQKINNTKRKLEKLGVDLTEYDDATGLLEEAIAVMFTKTEKQYELALDDVQWWLYEDVDKVIMLADKTEVNVTQPKAFIQWLEKWYAKD